MAIFDFYLSELLSKNTTILWLMCLEKGGGMWVVG